jgi:hypothetical protein
MLYTLLVPEKTWLLPVLLQINKQIKVVIKNLPSAAVALPERPESKGRRPSLLAGWNTRMLDHLHTKKFPTEWDEAESTNSPLKNEGGHWGESLPWHVASCWLADERLPQEGQSKLFLKKNHFILNK